MWTSRALIVAVYATVVPAASSLAGFADQSGGFIGTHEIPGFVCKRVELVSAAEVSHAAGNRFAPAGVSDPGSAVCARED